MMKLTNMLEQTLFLDVQQAAPGDFCPVCGGERYLPGLHCLRCERNGL